MPRSPRWEPQNKLNACWAGGWGNKLIIIIFYWFRSIFCDPSTENRNIYMILIYILYFASLSRLANTPIGRKLCNSRLGGQGLKTPFGRTGLMTGAFCALFYRTNGICEPNPHQSPIVDNVERRQKCMWAASPIILIDNWHWHMMSSATLISNLLAASCLANAMLLKDSPTSVSLNP